LHIRINLATLSPINLATLALLKLTKHSHFKIAAFIHDTPIRKAHYSSGSAFASKTRTYPIPPEALDFKKRVRIL
jgi:hypothetical protein